MAFLVIEVLFLRPSMHFILYQCYDIKIGKKLVPRQLGSSSPVA